MKTRKKLQVGGVKGAPRASRVKIVVVSTNPHGAPRVPHGKNALKSSVPHVPHGAPRAPHEKGHTAPSAPRVYRRGAVGHDIGGAPKSSTRNFLQAARFNERGRRIGETAPGATLSNHEVELMRVMHEEFPRGHPQHIGHRRLAAIFHVSRTTASNICHYRKRIGDL